MGNVYLLGDREKDNIYKIGVTRGNVEKRIKSLQTGNCGEIYLVCKYETKHPFIMEQMLHKHYINEGVSGEWFYIDEKNIFQFKEVCDKMEKIIESLKDNHFFKKKLNMP